MGYRFEPNQKFLWKKTPFKIIQIKKTTVLIENVSTGERQNVEESLLVSGWANNEIQFEASRRLAKPSVDDSIITEHKYSSWDDVNEELRKKAEWRLKVIQPLLNLKSKTRQMVKARVEEMKDDPDRLSGYALSEASVYRWIKYFEDSRNDMRALIDSTEGRRGGAGKKRQQEEIIDLFEEIVESVYLVPEKTTKQRVHEELARRVSAKNRKRPSDKKLKTPSYPTVSRWIDDLEPERVLRAKLGDEAAENALRQYGKVKYPQEPLQMVEIDHTPLDLMVLHENGIPLGRLNLTFAIDTATRYPHGYYAGFAPPGYLSVMECLKHAIRPKNAKEKYGTENEWLAYGVPVELIIDNGPEFKGNALRNACYSLGITIIPTGRRQPWQKPTIERFFRTQSEGVIHTLPGTTFSNIFEKGDYNPEEQTCIFVDQIDRIVNLFLVDYYAQKRHRGLKGIPARQWERKTREKFIPNFPVGAEELDIMLRPSDERVIWHYGIQFRNLRYNDIDNPALSNLRQRMEGEKVKIKYSPGDLGHIYIFDKFYKPKGRYIKVPALDPDYATGLSLWQHQIIERRARETDGEVDIAALWRARERIAQIVQEGLGRKMKIRAAHKSARFATSGTPTRDYKPFEPAKQQDVPEDIPTPPPESPDTPLFSLSDEIPDGWSIEELD